MEGRGPVSTFSLMVKQVFNFSNGRTVLAGLVEGEMSLIRPGRYGLYRGGELVREVDVEGEMIPKTEGAARNERAVSIVDGLGFASGEPQEQLTLAPLRM